MQKDEFTAGLISNVLKSMNTLCTKKNKPGFWNPAAGLVLVPVLSTKPRFVPVLKP